MSEGDYIKIDRAEDVKRIIPDLTARMSNWDYTRALTVKLQPYSNPRTLSQNNLFHKWCKEVSDKYVKKAPKYTPEVVKDYLKFTFLGTYDLEIGARKIPDQLKSTSGLKVGEMVHFMDQVYHWAADNEILLTIPENSEYRKLKKQQDK
jgi:hypothetical protein|tara:strand:+ start:1462 stop:1908 length:447 start_codon:yes stop_codon:yes gene_type:complete